MKNTCILLSCFQRILEYLGIFQSRQITIHTKKNTSRDWHSYRSSQAREHIARQKKKDQNPKTKLNPNSRYPRTERVIAASSKGHLVYSKRSLTEPGNACGRILPWHWQWRGLCQVYYGIRIDLLTCPLTTRPACMHGPTLGIPKSNVESASLCVTIHALRSGRPDR